MFFSLYTLVITICILYGTLTGLIYKNIDPRFSVRGCDIARACKGYITFEDTKPRVILWYIRTVSVLSGAHKKREGRSVKLPRKQ